MSDNEKSGNEVSRRTFVGTMATAAGVLIVPRHVLGGTGFVAPSDKVNIATVGYRWGQGTSNTNALLKLPNVNIVALCDVDDSDGARKAAAKLHAAVPNHVFYKDYRVMLEKQKDIDGVVVATPDHTHAVVAMASMQLGKHVYVQKPLTHTVSEARALTEAARRYKVVTQMGNQGRSGEGVRLMQEWLEDGAIGKVHEVHCWTNRPIWPQGMQRPAETPPVPDGFDWDLWVGPAPMRPYHPTYHPTAWRAWWDFGCGALGDMACHVMDAAYSCLKLGYPTSVTTYVAYNVGPRPNSPWGNRVKYDDGFPPGTIVHLTYPARGPKLPAVKLHWYDGGLLPERPEELEPQFRLPESGTIFVGDKGKAMCETYSESPRLIPASKMAAYKRPKKTIPRVKDNSHEGNWIDGILGKLTPDSNFDYSGPFTETVLLGNIGMRFASQKLEWDGKNMKVLNVPEANEYVQHKYRPGWSL